MQDITFFQTELQRELLIAKIRANPSLKDIFKKKKNITTKIEDEIKHRINGLLENWLVIHLKGSTGSLKSSCAMTFAQKLDPHFKVDNIQFQYETFREAINESQPLQAYQLDEQIFTHGSGSTRILQDLANLIETLRKRQNSMIIVTPELKYFPEEKFTYVMETIDDALIATCPHNKKPHEPRLCKCYQQKTSQITTAYARLAVKKEDYYLGFYIIKIDWNNQIWQEYKTRKDHFIEQMRKSELRNHDYKTIAEEIMQLPDYKHYSKNKKGLAILVENKHPNLTTNENQSICEQIKILQRMQEEGIL